MEILELAAEAAQEAAREGGAGPWDLEEFAAALWPHTSPGISTCTECKDTYSTDLETGMVADVADTYRDFRKHCR